MASKLLSLKEWLTLDEAAAHLSAVFSEAVSVADLYRFALAGHLILSANFVNHGRANIGKKMAIREAGFKMMPGLLEEGDKHVLRLSLWGDSLPEFEAWVKSDESREKWLAADEPKSKFVFLDGMQISAHECVHFQKEVVSIDGVWDLPMIGGERLDIEHALQGETGGPPVELINLEGAFLSKPDGTYARLLEHFNDNEYANDKLKQRKWDDPAGNYPAGGIPGDAPIVVRPQSIARFIALATGSGDSERPLDERERTTLLCIIGALAREQRIDLSQPMKAGDTVAAMAPELDLSGRTIGEKLKQVGEAMGRRTR